MLPVAISDTMKIVRCAPLALKRSCQSGSYAKVGIVSDRQEPAGHRFLLCGL